MIGWNADLYLDPDFATYKSMLLASIRKSVSDELVAIAQSAMEGTFVPGQLSNGPDGTALVGLTSEHDIPFGNGIAAELQSLKPTL
jgi:hypothetical protein